MNDIDWSERRTHQRADFANPVELKIFLPNTETLVLNGTIENLSLGGASIFFEDKYGRVNSEDIKGLKAKISITMSQGENIAVLAYIRWIKHDSRRQFYVSLGIQFESMESWQAESINGLIGMKHKDHNMMWSLWERLQKKS